MNLQLWAPSLRAELVNPHPHWGRNYWELEVGMAKSPFPHPNCVFGLKFAVLAQLSRVGASWVWSVFKPRQLLMKQLLFCWQNINYLILGLGNCAGPPLYTSLITLAIIWRFKDKEMTAAISASEGPCWKIPIKSLQWQGGVGRSLSPSQTPHKPHSIYSPSSSFGDFSRWEWREGLDRMSLVHQGNFWN